MQPDASTKPELTVTKRPYVRRAKPEGEPMSEPATASTEQNSAARAAARLKEIRGQSNAAPDRDKFWAPQAPDGWDYQWKRRTLLGKEDPSYQVELIRQGWEPVPLARHPDMMPPGWAGGSIEVDGMILMERPMVLTKEARMRDDAAAREAVRQKEAQLGHANKGELSRDGKREISLRRTYEPIAVPADE